MGNGFPPAELITVSALVGTLLAIVVVFFIGYLKSHKVDEAIRIILCIIVSQEIEKAGKGLEYHNAVGPNAHENIAKT